MKIEKVLIFLPVSVYIKYINMLYFLQTPNCMSSCNPDNIMSENKSDANKI